MNAFNILYECDARLHVQFVFGCHYLFAMYCNVLCMPAGRVEECDG